MFRRENIHEGGPYFRVTAVLGDSVAHGPVQLLQDIAHLSRIAITMVTLPETSHTISAVSLKYCAQVIHQPRIEIWD